MRAAPNHRSDPKLIGSRPGRAVGLTMGIAAMLVGLTGCLNELEPGGSFAAAGFVPALDDQSALERICAEGDRTRGIDVSKYQSTPDWDKVANDDVNFAFIRISDGLNYIDNRFDYNWAEARRVGVPAGAYQFFRPNLDAIAQAELFVDILGDLQPGDLPPVLDIEATGGLSASTVAARAKQWLDYVEEATGVRPIIYSSPYFWRDQVGAPSWGEQYTLWLAHYTTGCPLTPEPWAEWTFHQFTDAGTVNGITGGVDLNWFNGTPQDLAALTVGGTGLLPDGCTPLGENGGFVEEDSACASQGGPVEYIRNVSGEGHGGNYRWTGATASTMTHNYARWLLPVEVPGTYRISVYVEGTDDASQQARYQIRHQNGQTDVIVNQSVVDGYVDLGEFDLAGGDSVRVNDNTGELSSLGRKLLIDAIAVMPLDQDLEPEPQPEPEANPEPQPEPEANPEPQPEPEANPEPQPEPEPDPIVDPIEPPPSCVDNPTVVIPGQLDCHEEEDVGFDDGSAYPITVVTVQNKPVETYTANAYWVMREAALADGVDLQIVSGFRTMAQQEYLYACYVNCNCNNCNLAAYPGTSNHQSGTALDLNTGGLGVYNWLYENGADFGFYETVPSEDWHWEFIGSSPAPGPCAESPECTHCTVTTASSSSGHIVEEDDYCTELGGDPQWLRAVTDAGHGGDYVWTGATSSSTTHNYARYEVLFEDTGMYAVDAFIDDVSGASQQARYDVQHIGGKTTAVVNQADADGFISLGNFAFAAGTPQSITLGDNTGESSSLDRQLVFDAVRFTLIDGICPLVEIQTNGGSVNIRSGPGTNYGVVTTFADGERVERLDTVTGQAVSGESDWHQVRRGQVVGYITALYASCSSL